MTIFVRVSAAMAAAMMLTVASAAAEARRPETVENTQSVFKRVLPEPGTPLYRAPDGETAPTALVPLYPVYVYKTQGDWLEVGRGSRDGAEGWIKAEAATPWDTNIVGAFSVRGGRPRQIFFENEAALDKLLNDEAMPAIAPGYREAAEDAQTPAAQSVLDSAGINTIEPQVFPDISEEFYLMPITAYDETRHPVSRGKMLKMEVAALPLNQDKDAEAEPATMGVIFVVDTTRSMQPYIDVTLEALKELISNMNSADAATRFNFGVIGFRDDPSGREDDIVYRTNEYDPLKPDDDTADAVAALDLMEAMPDGTSTWGFAEDSIAGVRKALMETKWADPDAFDFGGRVVVLITDASPKASDDERAASPLTPEGVRKLAREKRAAVVTVHLKTPLGEDNHDVAEDAYRTMSYFMDSEQSLYFSVDGRSLDSLRVSLRGVITRLAESLTGEDLLRDPEASPNRADMNADLEQVGLAMRLAYLGRAERQQAPRIIRGWTTDLSFESPRLAAIQPRVLITRNQLSTMTEVIREIVETSAEAERRGDPSNFFNDLREIVVGMSSDPDRVVNGDFETLGGAMGEFLERLPYADQSRILGVTEDDWIDDPGLRVDVRDELNGLLEEYRILFDDASRWINLDGGDEADATEIDGDFVFAMPFDYLP